MERDLNSTACCHHWILGQPLQGVIGASCKKCGAVKDYPAVLDDLDPGIEPSSDGKTTPSGVATAAGGARPSSVALLTASE
jgi:hypothetical protein